MPIFDVYSEAPTVAAASCLANSAAPALTEYSRRLPTTRVPRHRWSACRPSGRRVPAS